MNSSSCEISGGGVAEASRVSEAGSRIHRFQPAAGLTEPNTWAGVPVQEYKAEAAHHCGVNRAVLIGEGGEKTSFQVRYFEIKLGGFSTLEHHAHEHAVVVLRGKGLVHLGGTWHEVGVGDVVYIAPHEIHQLRNVSEEPFGFLCVVDVERDRPVVSAGDSL